MTEWLPPGGLLFLGALAVAFPLLRGLPRKLFMLALPIASAAQLHALPDGLLWSATAFSLELDLVRVDALSRVFAIIFHIALLLGVVYAWNVEDRWQNAGALAYAGSAIAALFAGDLVTLFVYWEITAISSVFLVWARRSQRAFRAGIRYLLVQVGSGALLLAGSAIHYSQTGSIAFDHLGLGSLGTTLIFVAFGIKAAFPLLHNWLQDAYPEATVTGTVLLSAFTTKLAIYALARGFAGEGILVPIGATMTAFPIFYAVIENDLRRVLAYSLNNQLGFMVVGVGIGTELALNGAVAHVFAHILYKALLFMTMGAVLLRTGTANGSELGGLYRTMPWTTAFCIVGAASISAFPLFSGFTTKSMILTAAVDDHYTIAYLVLLFASAGVFHHSGIKIPFFAFFAHDSGRRPKEAPLPMLIAMGGAAAFCIFLGVYPAPLYALLPYPVDYEPYTTTHVVTMLQLLLFSALAFTFLMRTGLYPPEMKGVNLDSDWIPRHAIPAMGRGIAYRVVGVRKAASVRFSSAARAALGWVQRQHMPTGVLGDPWSAGATAMWAALLLGFYLLLYYLGPEY